MTEQTESIAPREDLPESAARDWVVWSHEHRLWWGPKRCGYHTHLLGAGLYTEAEAKAIEPMRGVPGSEQAMSMRDALAAELNRIEARTGDTVLARLRAVEAENARLRQSWTPALRDQLVRTYDARYEELSDDRYEDTEGGMSMREKSERSMAAVLAVFRHWCLTGEVKHWRDVSAEAHDAKA